MIVKMQSDKGLNNETVDQYQTRTVSLCILKAKQIYDTFQKVG